MVGASRGPRSVRYTCIASGRVKDTCASAKGTATSTVAEQIAAATPARHPVIGSCFTVTRWCRCGRRPGRIGRRGRVTALFFLLSVHGCEYWVASIVVGWISMRDVFHCHMADELLHEGIMIYKQHCRVMVSHRRRWAPPLLAAGSALGRSAVPGGCDSYRHK